VTWYHFLSSKHNILLTSIHKRVDFVSNRIYKYARDIRSGNVSVFQATHKSKGKYPVLCLCPCLIL